MWSRGTSFRFGSHGMNHLLWMLLVSGLAIGCGSAQEPGTLKEDDQEHHTNEEENNELPDCPSGEFGDQGACLPSPPRGTPVEECPSGEFRAHPSIDEEGICLPEKPRGTPAAECPSGEFLDHDEFQGEGICLPKRPQMEDWDCPEGWETETLAAGVTEEAETFDACRPPELPTECPEGQWPSLRDGGCVQHGIACPQSEPWPEESVLLEAAEGFDGTVLYVDADAEQGEEDGSRQAPFLTIGEGVDAAEAGDIVAVGTGIYQEYVHIEEAIAVVGACSAQTRVEAVDDVSSVMRMESQTDAFVGHLTVADGDWGMDVSAGADESRVRLDAVRAERSGVRVNSSASEATVTMIDMVADDPEGVEARGVKLNGDGQAEIDGAWLHTPGQLAMVLGNGFDVQARDVWSQNAGGEYSAVEVSWGGKLIWERGVIVDFASTGIGIMGENSEASLNDLFVAAGEDEIAESDPHAFIAAYDGAHMSAKQISFDGRKEATDRHGVILSPGATAQLYRLEMYGLNDRDLGTGVWLSEDAHMEVEQMSYWGGGFGLEIQGGSLLGTEMVLGSLPDSVGGRLQVGANAMEGGELHLDRIEFGSADLAALQTHMGGKLRGRDISMQWTEPPQEEVGTQGGMLILDAQAELERVLVEGAGDYSYYTEFSTLEAKDLIARDTRGGQTTSGLGPTFRNTDLKLKRFIFSRSPGNGLRVEGYTGEELDVALRDGVVEKTNPRQATGDAGVGVHMESSEHTKMNVLMHRFNVVDHFTIGMIILARPFGDGQTGIPGEIHLTAEDIRVHDIKPQSSDQLWGQGFSLGGIELKGRRWWISDTYNNGIWSINYDDVSGRLELIDTVIEDVKSERSTGQYGNGIVTTYRGMVDLSRALVSDTTDVGIWAVRDAQMNLQDVVVANTRPREIDHIFGGGIGIAADSRATLARVVLERNKLFGLYAGIHSEVTARDLHVSTTEASACFTPDCEITGGGIGVELFKETRGKIERFVIESSERAGIQITDDSELEAETGLIRQNLVGVVIEDEELSLNDYFGEVFMEENQQNISRETIAVPSMEEVIDGMDGFF